MALIKCTECGKEISDKALNCPNCGYPKNDFKNPKELPTDEQPELFDCIKCGRPLPKGIEKCIYCSYIYKNNGKKEYEKSFDESKKKCKSVFEINGIQFNILDIQKNAFFQSVANVTKKVRKLCRCEQVEAEEIVYGYFLSTHEDFPESLEALRNKIEHIKSWNGKKLYCPYCLSRNIDIRETVSESVSKGKSEVRKKSAVTRAGNKAGRAGMIMMTGGLWALTPKKSDYKETSQGKITYNTTTTKTCMDCGREII